GCPPVIHWLQGPVETSQATPQPIMPMRVKSRPLSAAREPSPMSVNWDANLLPDIGVDDGFREVIKKLSVYFAEVIQLPSTFEQLRTTTAGDSLRLLVDHLNVTCTNPAIVNALLALRWHYATEGDSYNRNLAEARADACEIVAWRFLTRLSEREAVAFCLYDIPDNQEGEQVPGNGDEESNEQPYVYESLLKGLLVNDDDQEYFRDLWRVEVVQEYSRLALTFPQDRLIALAGLATAVGRLRPEDQYIAGLWRSSLGEDLLWAVQPIKASARLSSRPAASWSWGSVTGAVAYGRSSRHDRGRRRLSESFQVYRVAVRSNGEGRFSDPLMGSSLKVTGQVLRGKLAGVAEQNKTWFVPDGWTPTSTYTGSLPGFSQPAPSPGPFLVAWDVMTRETSRDDLRPYRDRQVLFLMVAEQLGGPCGLLLEGKDSGSRPSSRCTCSRVGFVYSGEDSSPVPRRRGSIPDLAEEERQDRAQMGLMWKRWDKLSVKMRLSIE
ncbi:hypothetical protein BN1723_008722, partial [Verticillium longisporum]